MSYINKDYSLQTLRTLIQKEFIRSSNSNVSKLNEEQKEILELFNKRIFLEETVEESVAFNKTINWNIEDKQLKLVSNVEELIEIYKLRSEVYENIYKDEVPDTIEGLNFDEHDKHSAIIYSKNNGIVTSSARLIFDMKRYKLPSEEKFSFDYMREKYTTLGEISRNIVKHQNSGLNLDFKNSMRGIHHLFINNDIDMTLSGIKQEHFKLYSKFGGIEIEKEMESYGNVDVPFYIISWNPSLVSKFFERAFLK